MQVEGFRLISGSPFFCADPLSVVLGVIPHLYSLRINITPISTMFFFGRMYQIIKGQRSPTEHFPTVFFKENVEMNITKPRQWRSPENNLSHYYDKVHRFPVLTVEHEQALSRRWHESEDHDAIQALVNSHLRLVVTIARVYRGYELPFEEIISEGNLGLLQAAKRFDPDKGCRLSTYATWWIRATIHEYIMRSWSLVRIGTTSAQKKLFFNLRKLKNQLKIIDENELNIEQVSDISKRLNVHENEVVNMNSRMSASDFSLNAFVNDGSNEQWQERLMDEREDQEVVFAKKEGAALRRKMLISAMEKLSMREQDILIGRRLKSRPITLEELSKEHQISRERVRQIEYQAFNKIMKTVKSSMIAKKISTKCTMPPRLSRKAA